jgi:hypothetical protein
VLTTPATPVAAPAVILTILTIARAARLAATKHADVGDSVDHDCSHLTGFLRLTAESSVDEDE